MNPNYASILFYGLCNAKCPTCIGKRPEFEGYLPNIFSSSLRGIWNLMDEIIDNDIKYISLSGINTDPQRYEFEGSLISILRRELPGCVLSLHTNGRMMLDKIREVNRYDRVTLSFPSFHSPTYEKMMGVTQIPLERILEACQVPVKLSMLITEDNISQVKYYIHHAAELGIKRIVLRKLFGQEDKLNIFEDETPSKVVFGNTVYMVEDVEVTVWDYHRSTIEGIYLFPDGEIKRLFI